MYLYLVLLNNGFMTPEELLLPRYEFIADYPFNIHFKIGDIIVLDAEDECGKYAKVHSFHSTENYKHVATFYEDFLQRYPHIFKPLPWWAGRKHEDMPGYVKRSKSGNARRVERWEGVNDNGVPLFEFSFRGTTQRGVINEWLPATKEEYQKQEQK